jgi:hypothetical protein
MILRKNDGRDDRNGDASPRPVAVRRSGAGARTRPSPGHARRGHSLALRHVLPVGVAARRVLLDHVRDAGAPRARPQRPAAAQRAGRDRRPMARGAQRTVVLSAAAMASGRSPIRGAGGHGDARPRGRGPSIDRASTRCLSIPASGRWVWSRHHRPCTHQGGVTRRNTLVILLGRRRDDASPAAARQRRGAWTVGVTAAAAASAATGSFSAAAVTLTGETDRLVGMAVYARLVLVPVSVEHPESGLPAARTRPAPIGPSLLATASRRRWGRDPCRSATVGTAGATAAPARQRRGSRNAEDRPLRAGPRGCAARDSNPEPAG